MRLSSAVTALFISLLFILGSATVAAAYEWNIAEEDLSSLEISKESIALSGKVFELSVIPFGLKVNCTSMSGSGEITEGGKSATTVSLSGCTVLEFASCKVKSPGQSFGTLSMSATGESFAKEKGGVVKYYDTFSPKTTIEIVSELCPFSELTLGELAGTTAAEVPKAFQESKERTQTFTQKIAEESGTSGLTYAEENAVLTGTAIMQLAGGNAGLQMGIIPFTVKPTPIVFAGIGGANAKAVTIKNVSNANNIKLKDIKIMNGPYTLTEPVPACKGRKVTPGNSCAVTVTCNATPSNGVLFVEVDELNAADGVIGNGARGIRMRC